MSQLSTGLSRQEKRVRIGARPSLSVAPLAVPPLEAGRLLSLGMSRLYELMRTGELDSYRGGRARRITMASIHTHMARQLAADSAVGWRHAAPVEGAQVGGKCNDPAWYRRVEVERTTDDALLL